MNITRTGAGVFIAVMVSLATGAYAADLSDLSQVKAWDNPAPGIWTASLGNIQDELRYTDMAASAPRLDALKEFKAIAFPFNADAISYLVTSDNKIMIRIPAAKDETLYGFGLQFDGIKKSRKVLTLNVDHWAKGGGRTHAPVPF